MAAYIYPTKVELEATYIKSDSETVFYTAGASVTAARRHARSSEKRIFSDC